jgi:hypothetical protein
MKPKPLYWNVSGQTRCGDHTPYYRSDTWNNESWQKIPVMPETKRLKCEICHAPMSALVHTEPGPRGA